MRRTIVLVLTAALAVLALSPTASAGDNFVAPLSGDDEVPARDTQAVGVATFKLREDGTALLYKINVANIDNVAAAHIHCAAAGVNGSVGVTLFSGPAAGGVVNGTLAEGTITAADAGNGCAWTDLASALTLVAGPDVSADAPPQVVVSGHTVEILAELHDPALGRPSRNVRITASCPGTTVDPTGPPDDPSITGRGSVTVGGTTYEFDVAEQCDIGDGRIGVNLSDAEGNTLSLVAIGPTAFMTMNVHGEQWLAGLTGAPMEFVINGSSASWSGTLAQADTSSQSPASLEVTCGG